MESVRSWVEWNGAWVIVEPGTWIGGTVVIVIVNYHSSMPLVAAWLAKARKLSLATPEVPICWRRRPNWPANWLLWCKTTPWKGWSLLWLLVGLTRTRIEKILTHKHVGKKIVLLTLVSHKSTNTWSSSKCEISRSSWSQSLLRIALCIQIFQKLKSTFTCELIRSAPAFFIHAADMSTVGEKVLIKSWPSKGSISKSWAVFGGLARLEDLSICRTLLGGTGMVIYCFTRSL